MRKTFRVRLETVELPETSHRIYVFERDENYDVEFFIDKIVIEKYKKYLKETFNRSDLNAYIDYIKEVGDMEIVK